MNNDQKQIPHDDIKILDNLVKALWRGGESDRDKACTQLTGILSRYCGLGFDTMGYSAELMRYAASKGSITLTE